MTQKLFREILSFQIFASLEGFKRPFLLENCAKLPQYSISIPFKLPPMATSTGDVDQWIEIAQQCKYLPENDLKVSKNLEII